MAFKSRSLLLGGLLLTGLSGSAAAQAEIVPDQDFAAMEMSDIYVQANAYTASPNSQRPCTTGVPLFEEFLRREPNVQPARLELYRARMACAASQGDFAAAVTNMGLAEGEGAIYDPIYGVYLARMANDPQMVAQRVRFLATESPVVLVDLSPQQSSVMNEAFRYINEHSLQDEIDSAAAEAFRLGRFVGFADSIKAAFAMRALPIIMAEDPDRVGELLTNITYPGSYVPLLILREYESIWQQIEARVGPGFTIINGEYAAQMAAEFEQKLSTESLNEYAQALAMDGQHQQAIALVDQWRSDRAAEPDIDEQLAWAMNQAAFSHDILGNRAQADAIMDELAALEPASHPWVVSMVINRGERFVMQERWAESLAANQLAQAVAGEFGTPFARLLTARNRACAFAGLGRRQDALAELAIIREEAQASYTLTATGLMCLGENREAEELILAQFSNEQQRTRLIYDMQDERASFPYTHSALPNIHQMLDSNRQISAQFLEYGRLIPDAYLPNLPQQRAD